MTTENRIIAIASKISNKPINSITLDTSLRNDLNLDSLSLTELIIACEDEFQIEINLDHPDTVRAKTLKDLHEAVIMLTASN